ncbi:HNH endonuclease signature motif containing protein [Jeotgalibacillus proteolyticus]|uniref:HNH endonuclease signature motif containing protein n=1 Tax=Jeotgalibacillus proteolyticus TaxID=2082395 RepID=UPI003CFA90D8
MGRDPIGRKKRRYLRKEVGFGCPVEGCRVPFLEYHHFDPPYREGKMHNQDGMIALCPTHHRQADQQTWSVQDLHDMKNIKVREPAKGKLEWSIAEAFLVTGSNYFLGSSFNLRINNIELFSLQQDHKGRLSINALLWNENREVVAEIKNNDMLINHMRLEDVDCMSSGKEILFKTANRSNFIQVRFERKSIVDVIKDIKATMDPLVKNTLTKLIEEKEKNGMINLIKFNAKIKNNEFIFDARDENITFDFRKVGLGKGEYTDRVHANASLKISSKAGKELIYLGN